MFFSVRRLCLTGLLLTMVTGSCSRARVGPPPGFAVVRFENLSGDPALEWLGRAASEVLSTSLDGALEGPVISSASISRLAGSRGAHPPSAPGLSSQRASVLLSGAKRLISGYFEQTASGVRIHATDEDLSTGKTVRTFSVAGPASLETLLKLAKEVAPAAHPYLTGSNDAVRFYSSAMEAPAANAGPELMQSVTADPNFGPSWAALVRVAALQGDKTAAVQLADKALGQKLDRLSAATVKVEKASLLGDEKGRVAALAEVIDLSPGDTSLLRQLAESKTAAGQFAEAASFWQRLITILPDDADAWNQLGYTRAWSGDYPGALAALREYARVRPNEPNPADSTGDVHFLFRKYPEAAASYMQSVARDPAFGNGSSLYKAAWSKYLAGDKPGADKAFAQLLDQRERSGGQHLQLLEADWKYRTGRETDAIALLRKSIDSETAEMQAVYRGELAVWELLAGDRQMAAHDAAEMGPPKTAVAAMIRFITLPSASAAEWEKRADAMLPGPALTPIRRLALGYALILDGKKREALPVFAQIAAASPASDFAIHAVYSRLKGEEPKLAVLPDPNSVNQFGAVTGK